MNKIRSIASRARYSVAGTAIVAVLAAPLQAQTSAMCVEQSDGRFSLDFEIRPSLVVTSDSVLDATRGDLGLDGAAGERAFSFSRTIGALLESANAPSDAASQQAFLQTMLDSFAVPAGQRLNADAGIMMPFDDRQAEATLSAAALLDEASPDAMVPLALFNRFDLAPEDWSHCGEHRIVYGKNRTNPASPLNRFLLIFEAMVPNPSPADGERGCRRVAEFWAGLSGMSETDQAAALSSFYYDGETGHPDGDLIDPVVNFRNFGGDGSRGQVRANAFVAQPWQLREWLTQLTFSTTGPALAFVPVTVKDNPLAQLYNDDITAHADVMAGNVPAAVTTLHGQFVQALTSSVADNLLSETTPKHQRLVAGLEGFDLGPAPVDEETILLNTIALGNYDRFNEHQSTSQGFVDAPGQPAGSSVAVTALLDAVGGATGASIPSQTGQTLLNRARAATCGGCHMTASRGQDGFDGPGVIVRENIDGTVVRWPDVHAGGFVHVNELDRALSPALENELLPFRRYVLGLHLCRDLDVSAPDGEEPEVPEPYAMVLSDRNVEVETVATSERYIDEVIDAFVSEAVRDPAAFASPSSEAGAGSLSPEEQLALREATRQAIDAARAIELELTDGAFVETRRPH